MSNIIRSAIPITIHPLFPVVAFFLAYLYSGGVFPQTFIFMAVIALSILVHEFGHALAGIFFKQKVKVSLLPFGGLTERQGKPLRAWQDFIIVLMGPIFGLGLGLAAYYLVNSKEHPELWEKTLAFTAIINFFWTVLNLVPVIPLDGGQLVRIVLQGIWGVKGLKAACIFSMMVGVLIAIFFITQQDFLIASFFAFFTYESWTLYDSVRHLINQDIELPMQRLMGKGERAFKKGDIEKAKLVYEEIRDKTKSGSLFNLATQRLAYLALQEKDYLDGYWLLEPIKDQLSIDGQALFHELSFAAHYWEEALNSGTIVAKQFLTPKLALENAQAAIKIRNHEAAAGWAKAYKNLGGDPAILDNFF